MSNSFISTRVPRIFAKARKAALFVKCHGLRAIKDRHIPTGRYHEWIQAHEKQHLPNREESARELATLRYRPLISIVLPTFNSAEQYLRSAIESVRNQMYPNWELCIADDCSSDSRVREVIAEYCAIEPRIKTTFLSSNSGISVTTNAAAALARGDFIGFLDHDDILCEHALVIIARELNIYPQVRLIFSDEDRLSAEGKRHRPYFKDGWNPELMLAHNAVCHFMVVSASVFMKLGGMRSECDGAQDWDLALRISECSKTESIRHVSEVLYHWRETTGSTAQGLYEKPYVQAAQVRVVQEHLFRRGEEVVAIETFPATSMLSPCFVVPSPAPKVSLFLLEDLLTPEFVGCFERLLSTAGYSTIEIVVVGEGGKSEHLHQIDSIVRRINGGISVMRPVTGEKPATSLNRAVSQSNGSILCFLSGALVSASPDWLRHLLSQVCRPDVAVAGPKVLTTQSRVKSLGLVADHAELLPAFAGAPKHYLGDSYRAALARDVAAISEDCVIVKGSAFDRVGGFSCEFSSLPSLVADLCLKMRELDMRVICTPRASVTTSRETEWGINSDLHVMREKWSKLLERNKFWSPHIKANGRLRCSLR